MNKVKIVIEFDVPDGWEGVEYRIPERGEYYLDNGNVELCEVITSIKYKLILKPATVLLKEIKVGDKFHFVGSFDTYTKCSTDYAPLKDLCVSVDKNNKVFVCSKYIDVIKVD